MPPAPELLPFVNLMLCIIIDTISIWSYRKTHDPASLYIGAAFALFGISHFVTLLGLAGVLEPYLILIRTFAYLIVIIGLLLTVRLILGRKTAEKNLRENEAKYRALFEAKLDAALLIEKKTGTIIDVNTAAIQLYGYSRDEFLARKITDISNEPRMTQESLNKGQERVPLRYHKKKDGTVFPLEANISSFTLQNKEMVITTIRDISERVRTTSELEQAHRKLALLSGITRHDILNQLTSLSGFIQLSREKTTDPWLRDAIEREERSVAAIQDLISFTKDFQDIGGCQPQWQNLQGIIERAAALIDRGAVSISITMDDIEVYSDPLLEKVFYNLIDDAIRHGKTLTQIRFSYMKSDDGIIVFCEDNGIGIPYDEKEQVFERGIGRHTGYGLFLSREILRITGLFIKETGIPGKGARFEILVPAGLFRISGKEPQAGQAG